MHLPPGGRRSHDGWILQLTLQSVFITNKVVSSIPVRDEVYSSKEIIHTLLRSDGKWFRLMVFNVTFNNIAVISWRSILLLEETGLHGENHRPDKSLTNFIT
jgi:hypothetical protein